MEILLEIMPIILLAIGQLMHVVIICRLQRKVEELWEMWEIIVKRATEAFNDEEE